MLQRAPYRIIAVYFFDDYDANEVGWVCDKRRRLKQKTKPGQRPDLVVYLIELSAITSALLHLKYQKPDARSIRVSA